jgi:hypothetical protein
MYPYQETEFFWKCMYYFDRIRADDTNWRRHKKSILSFMEYIVQSNLPASTKNSNYSLFTSDFTPFQVNNIRKLDQLKSSLTYNFVKVWPGMESLAIKELIRNFPTHKDYDNLMQFVEKYGDVIDNSYYLLQYYDSWGDLAHYILRFNPDQKLPSAIAILLFRAISWPRFMDYVENEKKLDDISSFGFLDFVYAMADVTGDPEEMDDMSVFEEMSANIHLLNDFLIAAQDEIELNLDDKQLIRFMRAIGFYYIVVNADTTEEYDSLLYLIANILLLIHRKNDYIYYKDMILKVLRTGNDPYDPTRISYIDYGPDITNFIYKTNLPNERLMCEFHRYLFGKNGYPELEYNSDIAKQIRNNWDQLCAIGSQGLLL